MAAAFNPTGKTTLADVIATHAAARPDAIAFIAGEESMTWREYRDWSDRLAGVLIECGLRKGDRLGIWLPDGCEVHVAFVACEKAGIIGMGISGRAGEVEIEHLLRVSGAIALLSEPHQRDEDTAALFGRMRQKGLPLQNHLTIGGSLRHASSLRLNGHEVRTQLTQALAAAIESRRAGPEDLFLLNSTSGTSGMPKCVTQHQSRWFAFSECAEDAAQLNPQDVFMRAVPASVGFGLWTGHFAPTLLGAPTVVLPKFSVEAMLGAIEKYKVSVLSAVSTQFIMMLNEKNLSRYDLSSLRVLFTGGEAVPYERASQFEESTGSKVLQFYGSNETGALSYTTARDTREQRLKTAGRVIGWMDVKLLDEKTRESTTANRGQPICKGPLTCKGYFNNEEGNRELFTADGHMTMSDIVTIDAEGYLIVVGRVGDFIIRGGKNISAAAVEEAVLRHPAIDTAAAVAMPDATFGERVCIYVSLSEGAQLTLGDLGTFLLAQGISKEWIPEKMIVLPELPTVSGGKIAKHLLRADISKRAVANE